MPDKELTLEVLRQIEEATAKIIARFEAIHQVSDFTDSDAGVDKMDVICMRLIVIGESLKNLDKITEGRLLNQYPEVDWKKAKGMRDKPLEEWQLLEVHLSNVAETAGDFAADFNAREWGVLRRAVT